MPARRSVRLVTLGCARNEVDSEELAGRLERAGWRLTDAEGGPDRADVTVVNTCGFIDAAKKDSIDVLLAAADGNPGRVVAVGCMAERYGAQLAAELPEATVLSFDDYPDIAARLDDVLAGRPLVAHTPRDRRTLLPISPAARPASDATVGIPGHAGGPRPLRLRLDGGPVAPLKLASGCDRRCSFCAIPSFRGAFVSRPPADLLAEARWLAEHGTRELLLVSENSTSYGKDLGNLRLLEELLPQLAAVDGISRVRVSYLQPAEMRPSLIDALTSTPGVAPYFDLSFQHASAPVLRRMRRFGDSGSFLALLAAVRDRAPEAGARSNIIVGFPGETEADLRVLEEFIQAARLDAVGVFGYSAEEGTEAAGLPGMVDPDDVAERVERISALADEIAAQRADDRIGTDVSVLVEETDGEDASRVTAVSTSRVVGRGAHQGPDVDGTTAVLLAAGERLPRPGDLVSARVSGADGVDLVAASTPSAVRIPAPVHAP